MARPRMELHRELKSITPNVYFQPPPTVQMQYPCIVYKRDEAYEKRADNQLYLHAKRYSVTVVDRNPDSPLPDMVKQLPMCTYNRFYTSDDLNHDVFSLYF